MQRKTSFQNGNGVACLSVTGYLSDFERESPQILTKGPRPFSRSCLHVGESLSSCRSQSCCVSLFFRNSPVTVGKTTWTTQQNSLLEKGAAETERRNRRPPPSLRKWKGKFFFEFRGRPTDRPSSWVFGHESEHIWSRRREGKGERRSPHTSGHEFGWGWGGEKIAEKERRSTNSVSPRENVYHIFCRGNPGRKFCSVACSIDIYMRIRLAESISL